MKKLELNWSEYIETARLAAAEGAVLLKNDRDVLPVKKGSTVSLFGRAQFDYVKCGTGSGGLVNVPYVVNYYDGVKACEDLKLYEPLSDIYRKWIGEHPFDKGGGWAQEPFSQVEMPVDEAMVKDAAAHSDVAVVILARLAGEDKDIPAEEGAYLLREDERALLKAVCSVFDKTAVLINSGDIIDMSWIDEYDPGAIMYLWQGGCEGGNAMADLLCGKKYPSGKLTETIAFDIKDYPAYGNFGDPVRAFYKEDIYVGYRYFETFSKDRVRYPFGFGLTYTEFEESFSFSLNELFEVKANVKNTGKMPGRQVIQVYCEAPQGKLGKPARVLAAFGKTKLLNPGESETLSIKWGKDRIASYDDSGATGHKNAFVLEAGEYIFHAGSDVRSAKAVGSFVLNDTLALDETEEALYPIMAYDRIVAKTEGGVLKAETEATPLREYDPMEKIAAERDKLTEIPYTGDKGITLTDVKEGRASLDDLVAELTDDDLIAMSRGEGMNSVRVVPGTCAAYGGVTDGIAKYKIPAAACTDGPSGLRIDSGVYAMQVPNGTCLASTFDTELVSKLYGFMGAELLNDGIECLLGPGMNIKRHPLCGRNFEYFSEDPLVTGEMAAAQLLGMAEWNTTACIKHFACNNQENARYSVDSVVSARALREIYLKGYEIAVKEGHATHIMTTYGSLNGTHTAGSFELNTLVLRNDWGFKGVSVTDWWAHVGDELDPEPNVQKTSFMIRAQNDLYMVTNSSLENDNGDDSREGLEKGVYTRAELQRTAKNIIELVMNTPAYDRLMGEKFVFAEPGKPVSKATVADVEFSFDVSEGSVFPVEKLKCDKGSVNMIKLRFLEKGEFRMYFEVAAEGSMLSQMSATFSVNNTVMKVISRNGGSGEWTPEDVLLGHGKTTERFLKITFSQTGLKFRNVSFKKEN